MSTVIVNWLTICSPAEVRSSYLLLAPSPGPAVDFPGAGSQHRLGLLYLTAIASHFTAPSATPACTLAAVYATVLHLPLGAVLTRLRRDGGTAALLRPLLPQTTPPALVARALSTLRLTLLPHQSQLPTITTLAVTRYFAQPLLSAHVPQSTYLSPVACPAHG